eukprot:Hpha_TRINITY_DN13359_c0_g1::TRINITY_DN13359_c0_g1_i1::g.95505::m.95505
MAYEEKRVMVAVRVRPRLPGGKGSRMQQEEWQHANSVNVVDDTQMVLREQKQDESCRQSQFTFDYVFDEDSQQTEIYEEAVQELVDAALGGINTTILAYGQTGSGKTHTVLGEVRLNPLEDNILTPDSGLFLRVLKDLFEYRRRREAKVYVIVCLSCIEIYCDSARDLLSRTPQEDMKIQMTDDTVYMPTLTRVQIFDLQTVYQHFKTASQRRHTRATEANDSSSRSHALFIIDIIQQERTDRNPTPPDVNFLGEAPGKMPPAFVTKDKRGKSGVTPGSPSNKTAGTEAGKLQAALRPGAIVYNRGKDEPPLIHSKVVLADLAGSERAVRSGAVHGTATHKEMVKINSSLTALGNVVHALHEGQGHVPYRDSTLTRVLRPSFSSPSSRTLLCANLSPTQLTYDESWSTLQFANKVKAMKVNNSTVSAEQQQLSFDYLEVQKSHWALLADHHICHLQNEHEPVMRRYTDIVVAPYSLHRLRRKGQEKERAKVIQEVMPRAIEDKARIQAKIDKRKREEQDKLLRMRDESKQEEIDRYQGEVLSLQEKIQSAQDALQACKKKNDEQFRQCQREVSEKEGEEKALKQEQAQLRERITAAHSKLTHFEEDDKKLTEERKQRYKEAQDALSEKDRMLEQEDGKYAYSAWGHCVAQQFFIRFKAYRETQLAYYDSARQNQGRINQALGEARRLAKYLKEGKELKSTPAPSIPAPGGGAQSPMTVRGGYQG